MYCLVYIFGEMHVCSLLETFLWGMSYCCVLNIFKAIYYLSTRWHDRIGCTCLDAQLSQCWMDNGNCRTYFLVLFRCVGKLWVSVILRLSSNQYNIYQYNIYQYNIYLFNILYGVEQWGSTTLVCCKTGPPMSSGGETAVCRQEILISGSSTTNTKNSAIHWLGCVLVAITALRL